MTKLARRQEVASAARPARGARRAEKVRDDPNSAWLAAWQAAEGQLRRLAAAMGVERARIDDVLQEVFVAALEAGQAPRDDEGRRRWLFRVAMNRCRLEHRRRRRWQVVWDNLRRAWSEWRRGGGIDAAAGGEERVAVRRLMEELPADLREALVLRYYCDLDASEIGDLLGVPASTVRGRLRTARQRLARRLREAGFEPEE